MARKRMFDSEIIGQDRFLDLSLETKAIYFLLGMGADDEGFVSPKRVLKLHGGNDKHLQELINANFLIKFDTGVVLITDWNRNNYLDHKRIKETIYLEEKKQVEYDTKNYKYVCLDKVKQMLKENSIDQNNIDQERIVESSLVENSAEVEIMTNEDITIKEIIDYFNFKADTNYKDTSTETRELIKARLKENYTVDDFKIVIDNMCNEWLNTKYASGLRPKKLFGDDFESYLNHKIIPKKRSLKDISMAELEMALQKERENKESGDNDVKVGIY